MAVSLDTANIASAHNSTGTTLSVNTAPSGSVTLLLGGCGLDVSGGELPSSITYNAVSMTLLGTQSPVGGGTDSVAWYYMWNPPTGVSHAMLASFAATSGSALWAIPVIGASNLILGTGSSANPGTTASCTTPASQIGDLQLAMTMNRFVTITSTGTGQSAITGSPMNGINASISAAIDQIAGGTAGSFAWTGTNGSWAALGLTLFSAAPLQPFTSTQFFVTDTIIQQ